ncbi:MAG: glutaminyl-peptide cyclotransferase [Chlorobi bacterium]|nr:glutaminyl-peptide cyclotransferase [Chlorobiota bacterium]
MGTHTLRAELFHNRQLTGTKSVHIVVLPEKAPEPFTYRVVRVYPHDPSAYTQGLVYENGIMYESTGLRGESTLRKWVPETGKILATLSLPPDLFGEGCTLLGDEIYQITWTSRIGFVYDKNTFEVKNKLKYSTQGWGLTTDGKQLIMSDGSHYIYYLDPAYFSVTHRIEVYDNNGPVSQLNELEYIHGEIWANVYMTDDIVRIDPATGRVVARINLKGLLPNKDYGSETDVLNGIAWDPDHDRLFLTGKKWPKMFEIRPVPLP